MKFYVRQTKDVALVHDLNHQVFPEDEYYEHAGNIHWLAYADDGLAGFCMATDYGHGIMFLSRAGVLDEYRGRGLHTRMIKIRERYAKRHNFNTIITYTLKSNHNSFCHLIKMNYYLYQPDYEYAGKSVYYFIKEL